MADSTVTDPLAKALEYMQTFNRVLLDAGADPYDLLQAVYSALQQYVDDGGEPIGILPLEDIQAQIRQSMADAREGLGAEITH